MVFSYRKDNVSIPYTSRCVIHTIGRINNGDVVSITSPIFVSTNYKSKAINMSERFELPIRIINNGYIINDEDSVLYGTLRCDDNDTFGMIVEFDDISKVIR